MRLLPVLCAAGLLFACNGKSAQAPTERAQLRSLEWLLGKWDMSAAGRPAEAGKRQVEEWRRQNDSSFTGRSYLLADGSTDTTFFESVTLKQGAAGLQYIVHVADQNSGQPVTFTRIDSGSTVYTFANPTHDNPQRIGYRKVSADSALATVEGRSAMGVPRVIEISLRRMR
ncbi:DUF6265 family protein [Flaviaesturariibacter amylovorans]|uniref:DUF6265 domain-containing protein n=1 Tax=Flaviaesturariibacter amylovorans TaxID=1084520 RepID=A0ABP8H8M4_9BACT